MKMDDKIIKEIESGNLVIMPTDTIYGIVADATKEDVIKKVFEAKERSLDKPLLILVSNEQMLKEYVLEIPKIVNKIMKEYWPGPLTILFKKSSKVSNLLTANSPFVAIRMPKDERLIRIMNKINKPLIATSANISSHTPITELSQIEPRMKEKISCMIDGGIVNKDASTLIKIENDKVKIIREGSLATKITKEWM